MWRIFDSMSGSYAGRMQPPGNPNITSTFSCSSARMSAWAPVSFSFISASFLILAVDSGFRVSFRVFGNKKTSPVGRLSARVITRRLRNYYDGDHDAASARHKDFSLPAARGGSQPANDGTPALVAQGSEALLLRAASCHHQHSAGEVARRHAHRGGGFWLGRHALLRRLRHLHLAAHRDVD